MKPSTTVKYCQAHDEWYSTRCAYCLFSKEEAAEVYSTLKNISRLTGANIKTDEKLLEKLNEYRN